MNANLHRAFHLCVLVIVSQFAARSVRAQFTAITNGPIVTDGGDSTGCAWGDYNNDGFLDLFVSNFGTPFNYLYRNHGDGSFARVTTGSIATDDTNSEGATWGDFDNDGFLDLFVAVGLGNNDLLYRNNGDGSFTKITSGPVVQSGGNSRGAAWADYDNDGFLDLFVSNEQGQNNFLLHNNGDGSFARVTSGSIVNDGGASYGCSWSDYDNDGFLDLFVANLSQNNFLYHNNHNGTFTRITSGRIVNDGGASQGCAWGDYDNDGLSDLFVANRNQRNFLYHNDGDGVFTAITNGAIVNDVGYSWSPAWVDYDNDGYLDLFVANGPPSGPGQNNFLYHNNGDGTFTRITTNSIVNDGTISDGCAWGDYNNDGFLDLFISTLNGQNNLLYRNNGNSNNWLTVRCIGQTSNRSAIGTKVRIRTLCGSMETWQMREISGGGGYGSQNAPYAYFGFGTTNFDRIRIEWPSGVVQELFSIPPISLINPRQLLTVTEPVASISPAVATVNAGETTLFTVSKPSPLMDVQWFHNGVTIPDANSDSLIITNVQASDAGDYSVRLGAGFLNPPTDIYLKPAKLIGPAVLQTNLQFISNRPGSNVTFQVAFTGTPPIRVQWLHGEQLIRDATNATLTLPNIQLADDGDYSVIVSNSFGAVQQHQGTLVVLVRPTITIHPVSQSVAAGGNAVFSASASGNPFPLSFRWRSNGLTVATITLYDTNSFFTLSNAQPTTATNLFRYSVVATNLAGNSAASSIALLTVLADTDGDGLPDEWELVNSLSTTNASDAILDSDGDGATNLQEYLAGTDPHDPQSVVRLEYVRVNDSNTWNLRFLAVSNRTYSLLKQAGLSYSAAWRPMADIVAATTNRIVEINQSLLDATPNQFFRLMTPQGGF